VALRIGETPRRPVAPGTPGRIWFAGERFMMDGYGFPPDVDAPETVDGWWGMPDVGEIDEAGRLVVTGRLDDCFRTDAGHVVNPAAVARALEECPGVTDVAAVPLTSSAGRSALGVLVESSARLDLDALRRHLWRSLPRWSQPRLIETTSALPRLPNGRLDRQACITRLERSLGADVRE
jgi:acyl-CoA synthetase (AMP-forming)/AMP-acid ligase II